MFFGLRYILENYVYRRWTLQVGCEQCLLSCDAERARAPAGMACTPQSPKGMQYAVTSYNQHCISLANFFQDVELADAFFAGHRAPDFSAFPYPRELFLKFIAENDGARGCIAEACTAVNWVQSVHASCAARLTLGSVPVLTAHVAPAPYSSCLRRLHAHQGAGAARGHLHPRARAHLPGQIGLVQHLLGNWAATCKLPHGLYCLK